MEYLKNALSFEAQADKLLERGLSADRDELIRRLEAVSYYRLSGYLHPFRYKDSDQYQEGTNLKSVWDRYCFDRRLRVLMLDAIERAEVAVRTQLVYHFAHAHGPFGHCDEKTLPNLKVKDYIEWRASLEIESSRSKDTFKKHFFQKYGDTQQSLPIWMVSELMSMGSLLSFYKGSNSDIQSDVAKHFGLPDALLLTWLRSLYAVRNICAHHSRLWNRELGCPPGLPQKNKHPHWHLKNENAKNILPNNRCGIILMICQQMLHLISPTNLWQERVNQLFSEYPDIPVTDMGLPEDWQQHPLWTNSLQD